MKNVQLTLVLLSSFVVLLLISSTTAAGGKACVYKCLRDVIKCKRQPDNGVDCCQKYRFCYFECVPDATQAPSCSSRKHKRGSWNKRAEGLGQAGLLDSWMESSEAPYNKRDSWDWDMA